ncbi:helix-turn-helix domain-containing protein [Microbacterium sp. XT11]|uniref:helix-turn-helix domain-containing protein n=1 Tax=Microbacterium sp. XT11 TaxID=367477 RepID=UPI000831F987
MTNELIGTAEAAKMLRIDRSSLVRRVRAGTLEPVQKLPAATGAYLFDRALIERLASGERTL